MHDGLLSARGTAWVGHRRINSNLADPDLKAMQYPIVGKKFGASRVRPEVMETCGT
jgi:hypothetical protein